MIAREGNPRPSPPAELVQSLACGRPSQLRDVQQFGPECRSQLGGNDCAERRRNHARNFGFMFWAAGCQGQGTGCTFPSNTCQGGMGVAAKTFNIPVPMPPLRLQ